MVRAAPRRERRQPARARRLPRPREPRERGGRRRAAVLAAAAGAGERVARRPRRDARRPRRRRPRRAGGHRRAGAPLSRPAPRRRHGGELRLRALGLPDRDLGRRMGRDRSGAAGTSSRWSSRIRCGSTASRRSAVSPRPSRTWAATGCSPPGSPRARWSGSGERNEERRASVLETFAAAGLDYVDVSSGDPVSIHASFLRWADARLVHGGRLG